MDERLNYVRQAAKVSGDVVSTLGYYKWHRERDAFVKKIHRENSGTLDEQVLASLIVPIVSSTRENFWYSDEEQKKKIRWFGQYAQSLVSLFAEDQEFPQNQLEDIIRLKLLLEQYRWPREHRALFEKFDESASLTNAKGIIAVAYMHALLNIDYTFLQKEKNRQQVYAFIMKAYEQKPSKQGKYPTLEQMLIYHTLVKDWQQEEFESMKPTKHQHLRIVDL